MELVLIAAVSENYVIGLNGTIPWRIPEDMKRFKELTIGHPVIMGRKTYESLPKSFQPLPRRLNIVLSSQLAYEPLGVHVAHSLEDALQDLRDHKLFITEINDETVFIIGGEKVYREAFPLAERIEMTRVHKTVGGDAFFPSLDMREWKEQQRLPREGYSFITYVRGKE